MDPYVGSNTIAEADILTKSQAWRWREVQRMCRDAYEATAASGNPLLFHGTSAMRATRIMSDGFLMTPARTAGRGDTGVHWGAPHPVGCAAWCAEDAMEADDPPTMLMARLDDVLASGTPAPDARILLVPHDGPDPLDWRRTLAVGGALVVVGGHRVANLSVLGLGDLPLHPRAVQVRADRLAGRLASSRPGFDIPRGFAFNGRTRFAQEDDLDLAGCRLHPISDRAMRLVEGDRARAREKSDAEYERIAALCGRCRP